MPYILYKGKRRKKKKHQASEELTPVTDACNEKSNQKNLGTITGSNLCTEIIEYSAPDEVAVCNLASLALPKYVDTQNNTFDLKKLHAVTKIVTKNLNKVIDVNYYPVEEARNSNMRHRP